METRASRTITRAGRLPRWLAAIGIVLALCAQPAQAFQRTVHAFKGYDFSDPLSPGNGLSGTLLRDASGALYGAASTGGAYFNGTIYKLTPPAPGATQWTVTLLHAFAGGADGSSPNDDLVMDASGAIYGTTQSGGPWPAQGTVFKLTPPAPGSTRWTKTTLHTFYHDAWSWSPADGQNPHAGLAIDRNGALYGTTRMGGARYAEVQDTLGYGTVFKLTPPGPGQTHWTETVLYRFQGGADGAYPMGPLTLDASGAIHGTTSRGGGGSCVQGCGTVFKLTAPATAGATWHKTTLRAFSGGFDGAIPKGRLLLGGGGSLFGTTYIGGNGPCTSSLSPNGGCGVVYWLAPPSAGQPYWTEWVLHSFNGDDGAFPEGGVIADEYGSLFGVTADNTAPFYGGCGCGVVYRLSYGWTGWSAAVLHTFDAGTSGYYPLGGLVRGANGNLYGVTYMGGPLSGGTAFEVSRY
jgi:hypothetical protein